jgi:hypothetical protein
MTPFDREALFTLPAGLETRWASPENFEARKGAGAQSTGGRKGVRLFRAQDRRVQGPGLRTFPQRHDPAHLGHARQTIAADAARLAPGLLLGRRSQPAISVPWGDFFGTGLGRQATFESAFFSNPEGRSFNCCIPMPFRRGMKVIVTNESALDEKHFFYDIDYTLGDRHPDNGLYLHACWRRESPTTLKRDYDILPQVPGAGRFLGANVGVIADAKTYFKSWWGEGEVKIYLDGDRDFPTLAGTGTEDYIGTAWGQGQYANLDQGCPIADNERQQYCFYRYHVTDPVYFRQDIRVAIQRIGCWDPESKGEMKKAGRKIWKLPGGSKLIDMGEAAEQEGDYAIYEREDDWSSCAYFYLSAPTNDLPPLRSAQERMKGLD